MFSRISSALWHYVSPVKPATATATATVTERKHADNRKHTGDNRSRTPSSLASLRQRKSMSPSSRIATWRVAASGSHTTSRTRTSFTSVHPGTGVKRRRSCSQQQPDVAVKRPRGRPPKPNSAAAHSPETKRPRGRPRRSLPLQDPNMDVSMQDLEGDTTLVNNDEDEVISSLMSEIKVAASPRPDVHHDRQPSWSAQDEQSDTLLDLDYAPVTPNDDPAVEPDTSPSRRAAPTSSPALAPASQIPTRDLSVFPLTMRPPVERLIKRGSEPLLPCTWLRDFPFLPKPLFFTSPGGEGDRPVLAGMRPGLSDFKVQKGLQGLLSAGPTVRDKMAAGREPQRVVTAASRRFMDLACRDAGLDGKVPGLLCLVGGGGRVDANMLQWVLAEKMMGRVYEWASWRRASGLPPATDLPCIYGVVVSHATMAIVGAEVHEGIGMQEIMEAMKTIGFFDFGVKGLDVWNGLAVALLVIHIRDVLRGYAV